MEFILRDTRELKSYLRWAGYILGAIFIALGIKMHDYKFVVLGLAFILVLTMEKTIAVRDEGIVTEKGFFGRKSESVLEFSRIQLIERKEVKKDGYVIAIYYGNENKEYVCEIGQFDALMDFILQHNPAVKILISEKKTEDPAGPTINDKKRKLR